MRLGEGEAVTGLPSGHADHRGLAHLGGHQNLRLCNRALVNAVNRAGGGVGDFAHHAELAVEDLDEIVAVAVHLDLVEVVVVRPLRWRSARDRHIAVGRAEVVELVQAQHVFEFDLEGVGAGAREVEDFDFLERQIANGAHVEREAGTVELDGVYAVPPIDAGNVLQRVAGVACEFDDVVGVDDKGVVAPATVHDVGATVANQDVVTIASHQLVAAAGAGEDVVARAANHIAVAGLEDDGHGVVVASTIDHVADAGATDAVGVSTGRGDQQVVKAVAVDIASGGDRGTRVVAGTGTVDAEAFAGGVGFDQLEIRRRADDLRSVLVLTGGAAIDEIGFSALHAVDRGACATGDGHQDIVIAVAVDVARNRDAAQGAVFASGVFVGTDVDAFGLIAGIQAGLHAGQTDRAGAAAIDHIGVVEPPVGRFGVAGGNRQVHLVFNAVTVDVARGLNNAVGHSAIRCGQSGQLHRVHRAPVGAAVHQHAGRAGVPGATGDGQHGPPVEEVGVGRALVGVVPIGLEVVDDDVVDAIAVLITHDVDGLGLLLATGNGEALAGGAGGGNGREVQRCAVGAAKDHKGLRLQAVGAGDHEVVKAVAVDVATAVDLHADVHVGLGEVVAVVVLQFLVGGPDRTGGRDHEALAVGGVGEVAQVHHAHAGFAKDHVGGLGARFELPHDADVVVAVAVDVTQRHKPGAGVFAGTAAVDLEAVGLRVDVVERQVVNHVDRDRLDAGGIAADGAGDFGADRNVAVFGSGNRLERHRDVDVARSDVGRCEGAWHDIVLTAPVDGELVPGLGAFGHGHRALGGQLNAHYRAGRGAGATVPELGVVQHVVVGRRCGDEGGGVLVEHGLGNAVDGAGGGTGGGVNGRRSGHDEVHRGRHGGAGRDGAAARPAEQLGRDVERLARASGGGRLQGGFGHHDVDVAGRDVGGCQQRRLDGGLGIPLQADHLPGLSAGAVNVDAHGGAVAGLAHVEHGTTGAGASPDFVGPALARGRGDDGWRRNDDEFAAADVAAGQAAGGAADVDVVDLGDAVGGRCQARAGGHDQAPGTGGGVVSQARRAAGATHCKSVGATRERGCVVFEGHFKLITRGEWAVLGERSNIGDGTVAFPEDAERAGRILVNGKGCAAITSIGFDQRHQFCHGWRGVKRSGGNDRAAHLEGHGTVGHQRGVGDELHFRGGAVRTGGAFGCCEHHFLFS